MYEVKSAGKDGVRTSVLDERGAPVRAAAAPTGRMGPA
jgi:hypothetical protein